MSDNNYQDTYEHQITEEETVNRHLKGCIVETIQYHSLVYELPMYVPFEVPFHLNGYEPTKKLIDDEYRSFYWSRYKKPKRKDFGDNPPPLTHYQHYYFKNKRTGNTVDVSYQTKDLYDKNHLPYSPLRVKFHSENEPVKFKEILLYLAQVMQFNLDFVSQAKSNKDELKTISPDSFEFIRDYYVFLDHIEPDKLFKALPFNLFSIEPSIDIRCPNKKSADYMHNCFKNLMIKRYAKQVVFTGYNDKITKDGRYLSCDYPTIYISDRAKAYRFTYKRHHYVRFEFMFDKDFINQKKVTEVSDLMPNRNAQDVWDDRCYFFEINVPKIKAGLYHKHPQVADHVISTILDRKKHKNGQPFTDWDRLKALKKYSVGDKKLFRSVKDYTFPKWLTLHKFISDAFSRLSMTETPKTGFAATPVSVPQKAKRQGITESDVRKACEKLYHDGKKITLAAVMERVGIKSKKRISQFADVIAECKKKSPPISKLSPEVQRKGTKQRNQVRR